MKPLIVGMIAGVFCTISFVPQVLKIFRTKQAKDLSLFAFSFFSFGIILWLIYGLLIKDAAIIVANSVTLVLALLIVAMKVKYG
ncbi:MAG: SemiSWEET transporter [Candidatus Omnitrophota bacterium]